MPDSSASFPSVPPLDRTSAQLTVRAVLTGMVFGGLLTACNVYVGLKTGWGMNMSIAGALLGFVLWRVLSRTTGAPGLTILESNINQTVASSAATVTGAGLVSAIPALTMLTGFRFSWAVLVIWTLSVMLLGIVVGSGVRRQLLVVDRLPFPSGLATLATIRQIYATGADAVARVRMLGVGAVFAGAMKLVTEYAGLKPWGPPVFFAAKGVLARKGIAKVSLANLTWMLDPSPLMIAVGVLIGLRAAVSVCLGALIGWGVLAPWALERGWAEPGAPDPHASWFGATLGWLLWPGVAIMVGASLTSLAFSWRSIAAAVTGVRARADADPATREATDELSRRTFLVALLLTGTFAVVTQIMFFGIAWWAAILAVLLTFVLALVAARVTGETNVTPVSAMGKVTQLMFGAVQPGNAAANLMSANVTGGAAAQVGDLLHDLKTGLHLGASPRQQVIAQSFGAVAGAIFGSATYLLIVPDVRAQLLTPEWPAPSVAAWKAVAELFMRGLDALPDTAATGMWIGGAVGIVLAVADKMLPARIAKWIPSPASLGLGFVIQGYQGLSMLVGAVLAALVVRYTKTWGTRFLIILASGFIAGESIMGVILAILKILRGDAT